jgi:hypothetical protein
LVAFHDASFGGDDVHSSRSLFVGCGVQQSIDFKTFLGNCHSQWVCQIRFALFNDRRLWESCSLEGRLVLNFFYFDTAKRSLKGIGVVVRGQLRVGRIGHLIKMIGKKGVFENLVLKRNLTSRKKP